MPQTTRGAHHPTTTSRRREREHRDRRSAILQAARTVFADKGYREATLDDIAEHAELAKGTLYNYFRNKEDLFGQVVLSLLDDVKGIAEEAVGESDSAHAAYQRYAANSMTYYRANRDILLIVARELNPIRLREEEGHAPGFFDRVREISRVLAGVLQNDLGPLALPDPRAEDLALLFVSMVHHRCMRCFLLNKPIENLDPNGEATFLSTLFFRGAARAAAL